MSDWDAMSRPDDAPGAVAAAAGGRAWTFGDSVDTDAITPVRFLMTTDPARLAQACFADLDPAFVQSVQPGDVVVAGLNFGCGSSREHAPIALKAAGVAGVVAAGFARIFYRNAINIGLPVLECPEAAAQIKPGDRVALDVAAGLITNLSTGQAFRAEPAPPFLQEIFDAGGLIPYLRRRLAAGSMRP